MFLTILLLQYSPPAPRGVNDSVLGTPEQFKVVGPARVCFNDGGLDLRSGEISYLTYMGIHSAALQVVTPSDTFEVTESDIFKQPKSRGRPVVNAPFARRYGGRFGVIGLSEFYKGSRLKIWVNKLPQKSAADVISRILPNIADKSTCKRRFVYGWFFDDDTKPKASL